MDELNTNRTDKITRVLLLYNQLLNGRRVNKEIFCLDNSVSERGFDRDIQDIRLFLSESFSGEDIIYDKSSNSYYMTGSRPKYMDKSDITIIIKLILSSGAFREDEAHALVEALLKNVPSNDRKTILNYLKDDIPEYAGKHDKAIVKLISDLYLVISSGSDITLSCDIDGQIQELRISPIRLEYKNGFFYLAGARDCNSDKIEKIRLDKINAFKIMKTFYAESIKNKYQQGGKHNG